MKSEQERESMYFITEWGVMIESSPISEYLEECSSEESARELVAEESGRRLMRRTVTEWVEHEDELSPEEREAAAWDRAVAHLEPLLSKSDKRAAFKDNPFR